MMSPTVCIWLQALIAIDGVMLPDGSAVMATTSVLGGKGLQRKLRGKRNEGGETRAPLGGKRRQLQMGIEDMLSTFPGCFIDGS